MVLCHIKKPEFNFWLSSYFCLVCQSWATCGLKENEPSVTSESRDEDILRSLSRLGSDYLWIILIRAASDHFSFILHFKVLHDLFTCTGMATFQRPFLPDARIFARITCSTGAFLARINLSI